jgi:hypothetical protein
MASNSTAQYRQYLPDKNAQQKMGNKFNVYIATLPLVPAFARVSTARRIGKVQITSI